MNVQIRINDCTTKIVGATNVVVNGVSLSLGGLHRVGGSALFSEMNNGVWFFGLDEIHQQVIFLRNVQIDKLDFLARNLFPSLAANLFVSSCVGIVRV